MNFKRRGFTLVELMIVVAIIGILVSVSLPLLRDYSVKARVSELILAAGQCRSAVSEAYASGASAPADNDWGCETSTQSTRYVGSVQTNAWGEITITSASVDELPEDARGRTIALSPTDRFDVPLTSFTPGTTLGGFKCRPGSVNPMPTRYLPGSCKG